MKIASVFRFVLWLGTLFVPVAAAVATPFALQGCYATFVASALLWVSFATLVAGAVVLSLRFLSDVPVRPLVWWRAAGLLSSGLTRLK